MIGLRGEFHLKVVNAQNGNCREERHFQNVILDVGLEAFARNVGQGVSCAVGKGTDIPRYSDVGLGSFKAATAMNGSGATSATPPLYEYSASMTGRFNAGVISDTITEVGVYFQGERYWCRQLILNEQGLPSALTVLPNEYLDVTYTLWYYPSLGEKTFSFIMNGVTYNCVSKPALLPRYSNYAFSFVYRSAGFAFSAYETQTLGDITSSPGGTEYPLTMPSNLFWNGATEPNSWSGTVTMALNDCNIPGGIGSALVKHQSCMPAAQISFTPKLPKDKFTQMSLTFSRSIGRYQP